MINTKGVGEGADIAAALRLAGKRGKVVVTNLHKATEATVAMSALELVLMEKQVRGSLFGSSNPRADIPRMLDLYRSGKLKLDELATKRTSSKRSTRATTTCAPAAASAGSSPSDRRGAMPRISGRADSTPVAGAAVHGPPGGVDRAPRCSHGGVR